LVQVKPFFKFVALHTMQGHQSDSVRAGAKIK
jgi:hypothetical protein